MRSHTASGFMRSVAPALAAALRKSRVHATKVEKGPDVRKLMMKKAVGKLKRGATFWDHAEKRNR